MILKRITQCIKSLFSIRQQRSTGWMALAIGLTTGLSLSIAAHSVPPAETNQPATGSPGLIQDNTVWTPYRTLDSAKLLPANASAGPNRPAPDREVRDIYKITGSSPSLTGTVWQNMLTWREETFEFAGHYPEQCFINGDPAAKNIYLTFDDGPDPQNTPKIMAILQEHNAAATFFLTGENMQAYPEIVKQLCSNGFSIGLHGWNHHCFSDMTPEELRRQIQQSNSLLQDLTGTVTHITRPPYGGINDTVIQTLTDLEQKVYIWSIDTLDWTQQDPEHILRNISENLRPGDIILLHSGQGQPHAAEILPDVIDFIRAQGYELASLS